VTVLPSHAGAQSPNSPNNQIPTPSAMRLLCCSSPANAVYDPAIAPPEAKHAPVIQHLPAGGALAGAAREHRAKVRPADPFINLPPEGKIRILLKLAPPPPKGKEPLPRQITRAENYLGSRTLTRRDALCMALELAIEHQPGSMEHIARRLLSEYHAAMHYSLFGTMVTRKRLEEWVRGIPDAQAETQFSAPEHHVQDNLHATENPRQNAHDPQIESTFQRQMRILQNRVPWHSMVSQEETIRQITELLQATRSSRQARRGLDLIYRRRAYQVAQFNLSQMEALRTVWSYIQGVKDESLQRRLTNSLVVKLREIGEEQPCGHGLVERLADVPTAIDFSVTHQLSIPALRDEMCALAARECEAMELCRDEEIAMLRSYEQLVSGSDAAPRGLSVPMGITGGASLVGDVDEADPMVDAQIKRECFLNDAQTEFVLLRGLDRGLVLQNANAVFPEDALLGAETR
jgi:hypothetical protein